MPVARSAAEIGVITFRATICENFAMDERRNAVQA
jgi:hypothetical protein